MTHIDGTGVSGVGKVSTRLARVLNEAEGAEKCSTCKGAGYHFFGTGSDAVCEECGGIGHMPKPKGTDVDEDVKVIESRLKSISHVASVDEWREASRLLLTKLAEKEAEIERLKETRQIVAEDHADIVEERDELKEKLSQAIDALEEIEGESSHDDADMTRINGIARDTLQSIKGDEPDNPQ